MRYGGLRPYTISYDMNGHGSVPDGVMTKYNLSTPLPYAPPPAKWRLVGEGTDYNLGASYPIESKDDVTFYLVS